MLVAIIGIDGSGKTTSGKSFAALLRSKGKNAEYAKLVHEDSPFVKYYKLLLQRDRAFLDDGVAQNYAFVFERYRSALTQLVPLLEIRDVVVLDRYVHCDIAFSQARGRRSDMFEDLLKSVPQVDLGFVLDLPAELAMRRIRQRNDKVWDFQENQDLLLRAREQYLNVAVKFGFHVIDAEMTTDQIVQSMLDLAEGSSAYPAGLRARS